jgi:hypothetical protein
MKYLLIAAMLISATSVPMVSFAEQKIVFCSEEYSAGNKYFMSKCGAACTTDCDLDNLLTNGWKIDTNMPKKIQPPSMTEVEAALYGCVCKGTQYVLSNADNNSDDGTEPNKNIELLKKEIELLKKENRMLKQENNLLTSKAKKKK